MQRVKGAYDWAQKHSATFEVNKFALVHFSRKRIKTPNEPKKAAPLPRPVLTLGTTIIQPSASTKFLEVHLDEGLRFQIQANAALAKGSKYMLAAKRLQKGKRGVPLRQGLQLYTGVVVPKLLYAAEVWCEPIRKLREGSKRRQGSVGFAHKFAAVQRMAGLFTTGAMKSTATTVLDAHADYLPMELLINRICFRAALRWAMAAVGHPMHQLVREAAKQRKNAAQVPLNKLWRAYPIKPDKIETIEPVRRSTKWVVPMKIYIAETKEAAQADEANDSASIKCYSDGSGYKGAIGTSAVMYRGGVRHTGIIKRTLMAYLGTEKKQTVYIGKLAGQLMDLHLLQTERSRGGLGRVSIYVNNQASLKALRSNKPGSGHHVTDAVHEAYEKVM